MSDTVRICSDRASRWRWGHFVTPVSLAFGTLMLAGAAASGFNLSRFSLIELGLILPASLALGYGVCWFAWSEYGRTAYEVENGFLQVTNGNDIVERIPGPAVVSFRMRDPINVWSFFTSLYPIPSWPRGVVTVDVGGAWKHVELPPLLLWGDARQLQETEDRVMTALGRH